MHRIIKLLITKHRDYQINEVMDSLYFSSREGLHAHLVDPQKQRSEFIGITGVVILYQRELQVLFVEELFVNHFHINRGSC